MAEEECAEISEIDKVKTLGKAQKLGRTLAWKAQPSSHQD